MKDGTYDRIWDLSSSVTSSESYSELLKLTMDLIKQHDEQGRLISDPFNPTRERVVNVPIEEIKRELKDRICLVTGGLGCVGSILVRELLKFDVKAIIILDIQEDNQFTGTEKVISIDCDIRDIELVRDIFFKYEPEIIFHAAAIRDPGFAESHVAETVNTNIFGTVNILKASEECGTVKQVVYSSTGKASRYFTEEVYACTKKISEFIVDTYARTSDIKYSMVRFTHILDNSLMNMELKGKSLTEDYVSVHSPGKFVTAQNATEAAQLMLNALVFSKERQCRFLLVRHLEWPVESFLMALYHIKTSGRNIPVIFSGNPAGYSEKFFRGQLDWSRPENLNLLINVYERKYIEVNAADDIIISQPCSVSAQTIGHVLKRLENVHGEEYIKQALIEGLKEIVRQSLKTVDKKETINILRWGLDPRYLEIEDARVSDFGAIIPLMAESLEGSPYFKEAEELIYQPAYLLKYGSY